MHCHWGTKNRAPRWTFTNPCKPEVRPGTQEGSASPAWLAAPAMNARDTTKVYIWRLDTGCGQGRGAQFVPIGMPTVCWKTFPAKTTKILSTRNSSILMMSSSEYLLLESECSFTKYVSSCPNTKYLYLRLPFLKMKAFRIILVSLSFNSWWGMVV